MNVAFLSLGGNLGNRTAYLKDSKKLLTKSGCILISSSSIYETESWGIASENKYLNQVIKIETIFSALELLKTISNIEKKLGRVRSENQYSDRNIDIDILFFNNAIINLKKLQIPHPRLQLREFILIPFAEIEPNFIHPFFQKTIKKLLSECKNDLIVKIYSLKNPINYICIEGNIGSGKSTLASYLSKKLKATYLPEQFEDNALLPLFYKQPKVYSFPLEYSFLISRFNQLMNHFKKNETLTVSDFCFYKCLWFAKINLKKAEYQLFKKHVSEFENQIPKPDLIIYLSTEIKNLAYNIKKRGRGFEKEIDSNYLNTIENAYKKGLQRIENIPKLKINIKKYHLKLEAESVKIIEKYLKDNFA